MIALDKTKDLEIILISLLCESFQKQFFDWAEKNRVPRLGLLKDCRNRLKRTVIPENRCFFLVQKTVNKTSRTFDLIVILTKPKIFSELESLRKKLGNGIVPKPELRDVERNKSPKTMPFMCLCRVTFIDGETIVNDYQLFIDLLKASGELWNLMIITYCLIKDAVYRHYIVNEFLLGKSKRGVSNEPRNVAIYLAGRLRTDALETIGKEFGLNRFSSNSSAIERVKRQIVKDRKFRKRMKKIRL